MHFLFVFLGGGLGALSRVLLMAFAQKFPNIGSSGSLLLVNVLGSLCAGVFVASLGQKPGDILYSLLLLGFLGGFTTFSSYALLISEIGGTHSFLQAAISIALHNVCAIGACSIGFVLVRFFLNQH